MNYFAENLVVRKNASEMSRHKKTVSLQKSVLQPNVFISRTGILSTILCSFELSHTINQNKNQDDTNKDGWRSSSSPVGKTYMAEKPTQKKRSDGIFREWG